MSAGVPSSPYPLDASPNPKLKDIDDGKNAISVLQEILVTLRKSNIVPREGETKWVRFWHKYNMEADEYDREFLERYRSDMNTTMIFSGLFTAVTATIASITISSLSPDPTVTTNILLLNILISLNHTGDAIPQGMPLPSWDGPSTSTIWFQTFLYASLVCSLLVALGAVLATQWLSRYSAVDDRGTVEDRGKRRQQKFDGLEAWNFRPFLEALPILLQFSLLLFGVSLCAYMWSQQHIVAIVLICANSLGGLLWIYTVVASTIYPDSPYDTPLSDLLTSIFEPKTSLQGYIFERLTKIYQVTSNLISHVERRITPLWQRIRWSRQQDVEEADSMSHSTTSTSNTSTLSLSTPHTRHFIQPFSARITSVLVPMFGPIIRAHKKRLSRSYPTPNDVQMAAVSWLLETSTNPEIHTSVLLLAAEIIWTDEMSSRSFSIKLLDLLLQELKLCFFSDDHDPATAHLRSDSVDKTVSLSASFLLVYWQLYRVAQDATYKWTRQSGRVFVRSHRAIVQELGVINLEDFQYPSEHVWILRHAHCTFLFLNETKGPRKLASVQFPTSTLTSAPLPLSFTPRLHLRISSLAYLAQVSRLDEWNSNDRSSLFALIGKYSDEDIPGSRFSVLLLTAVLLGFSTNPIHIIHQYEEGDHHRAAQYIVDEIGHYIHWRAPVNAWKPRIAEVFDIDEDDRLTSGAFAILTRLTQIAFAATPPLFFTQQSLVALDYCLEQQPVIRFTIDSDPATLTPSQAHLALFTAVRVEHHDPLSSDARRSDILVPSPLSSDQLVALLTRLCQRDDVDLDIICYGVTDAITVLYRVASLASLANDPAFHAALASISQVHLGVEDRHIEDNPFVLSSFVRMQHVVLSLVHSLADQGLFRDGFIPTFSSSFRWDLSQPSGSGVLSTLHDNVQIQVEQRDGLFTKLLDVAAEGMSDQPTWLDDPHNDALVREWIRVAHRWVVPRQPLSTGKAKQFSVTSLLQCARFIQPDETHWGGDLARVQQLLVVALSWSWSERLSDTNDRRPLDLQYMASLATNTISLFAAMRTWDVMEVEHYVFSTLVDVKELLLSPFVGIEDPLDSQSGVREVQIALERTLGEVNNFQADNVLVASEDSDPDGMASDDTSSAEFFSCSGECGECISSGRT